MSMDINDQSAEIQRINEKFKQALTDKISLYGELCESVKELTLRNARFLINENDDGRYVNESSIIKKELEQDEK